MSALVRSLLEHAAAALSVEQPSWRRERRRRALEAVQKTGLPTVRDEDWRFTSTRALQQCSFVASPQESGLTVCSDLLVPTAALPPGVHARCLSSASAMPELQAHWATVAADRHFAALNTASSTQLLCIELDDEVQLEQPLHVLHMPSPHGLADRAGFAAMQLEQPRLLLRLGRRSRCRLLEHYVALDGGALFTNAVSEVILEQGARLDHVRTLEGDRRTHHVATLAVRQARDSQYHSHVYTFGGALSRLDLQVELCEAGAACELVGLYHAAGHEHVDHHTRIEHRAPRTTCRESYRGLVDQGGVAVFDGVVAVHEGAQGIEARQENHNLLLAAGAVVHSKPHLIIEADDVQCSHGATVGSLDEQALFYLRSRGIALAAARNMLTLAFAAAPIEALPWPAQREQLLATLQQRLEA